MITDGSLSVLVVEDNPVDFHLLQRAMRNEQSFKLVCEHTLEDSITRTANEQFDVVLLDLSLPDSHGLATIDNFTEQVATPVVVLSNTRDESTALKSVQHGAQDYLMKDQLDARLLARTLRYAIERYALLEELHDIRQIARRDIELKRLQSSANRQSDAHSQASDKRGSLKNDHPAVFSQAMTSYGDMISNSLERREYNVQSMNLSKRLKDLALKMGSHGASPRDVMQVHTACVAMKLDTLPKQKNALCHEEARYLLAGLLGHLCYFYMDSTDTPLTPIPSDGHA